MWSLLLAYTTAVQAPPIIELRNAIIVDGSGSKGVRGSVWFKGDTIVAVGKRGPRATVVKDLHGLTLAPGFIDSHSHADGKIAADPSAKSQVTQGITTAIVGQDGGLSGTFVEAMEAIRKVAPAINYAAFTGHNSIREKVMGENQNRVPTTEELEKMKALVEADMKAGALGLSTGLEYLPGFYSKTEEVIELAKVASRYGGSYISHMRSEDRTMMESIDELIRIAREAKMPAEISHIKLGLPMVWGRTKEVEDKIRTANASGLKISADIYPYTYWQSTITVITNRKDWDRLDTWKEAIEETGGAQNIRLSDYAPKPEWNGKTIDVIAKSLGQSPEKVVQDIVLSKKPASVIVTAMTEKDIETFLKMPWTAICSDGGIMGSHPRSAGTFPRVLGYYVRERKVLPLEEAIRRMTSMPAARFRLPDRGLIAVGKKADLVVFNPKTIRDFATPANPGALSVGISIVVVNGSFVMDDGAMKPHRPGRILLPKR